MKRWLLAFSFLFIGVTGLFAHDTWLIPEEFAVAPGAKVALDLTSGIEFPALEKGPKRDRVKAASYRLAGHVTAIEEISEGPQSLRFATEVKAPGVAAFWVEFPPKDIELKPDQVGEYLEEIGASAQLIREWKAMSPPRWREQYSKHQKTFVRVGEPPANDQSWKEPVGVALEIVPEQDPTAAKAGGKFSVLVLKGGKAFPDFPLTAVAAGEKEGETVRTDKEGRATFELGKQGRWLLRGTEVRRVTRPDADWESDFTTLTLEAK